MGKSNFSLYHEVCQDKVALCDLASPLCVPGVYIK